MRKHKHSEMRPRRNATFPLAPLAVVGVAMGSFFGATADLAQAADMDTASINRSRPAGLTGISDVRNTSYEMSVHVQIQSSRGSKKAVEFLVTNDGTVPFIPQVKIYADSDPTTPIAGAIFSADSQKENERFMLMPGQHATAYWNGDGGNKAQEEAASDNTSWRSAPGHLTSGKPPKDDGLTYVQLGSSGDYWAYDPKTADGQVVERVGGDPIKDGMKRVYGLSKEGPVHFSHWAAESNLTPLGVTDSSLANTNSGEPYLTFYWEWKSSESSLQGLLGKGTSARKGLPPERYTVQVSDLYGLVWYQEQFTVR